MPRHDVPESRAEMSPRAKKIMESLVAARKEAVKQARLHGTPIIYMQDGKLIREWPSKGKKQIVSLR
jgi:hypothetical protein